MCIRDRFGINGLNVDNSLEESFTLIIDSDTDFSLGATTLSANSYSDESGIVSFNDVDISDGNYFTLGTEIPSLAPGGIYSNLLLWLKADADFDTSDSPIIWDDQSIIGHQFVQGVDNQKPTFHTEAMNFNPAINFDGAGDRMSEGDDHLSGNDALSTFMVVNSDTISQDRDLFNTSFDTEPTPWGLRLDPVGENSGHNQTLKAGVNDTIYEANEGGLIKTSPQILGVSWKSGNAPNFYVEGRSISANPATTVGGVLDGVHHLFIGGRTSNNWDGDISEVIFYADELSNLERNKVESYLSLKYGLTLSQATAQSYTASDGTEMWDKDTSGASTHNNDIAGIGRDDEATLGQVKSQSQNSDGIVIIEAGDEGTNSNPDFNDIADLEFLTWGNDNGTTSEVDTNLPSEDIVRRLGRTWQVQEVGELGTTTVQFDLSDLGINNRELTDFTLIVDSDTDFSSGAATSSATSYADDTVTFNSIDLEDGEYFSLGTRALGPTPGGIHTDLLVWLKADAGVTAVGSDDRVSDWADQSPNGYDFSQGSNHRRPEESQCNKLQSDC